VRDEDAVFDAVARLVSAGEYLDTVPAPPAAVAQAETRWQAGRYRHSLVASTRRSVTADSAPDPVCSGCAAGTRMVQPPARHQQQERRDRPLYPDTATGARVLARVSSKGTRATDLAEQARVTKQTVTFMVDQLERAGYVHRIPDPSDARARLVTSAERGLAAREVARRTEVVVQQEWTRHLGRRTTARLHQILTQLREITDPYR
jgi:DNA-binding MarR family transcriptional regulator